MAIVLDRHGIHGDIAGTIARFEALLAQLKAIAKHELPTIGEIAEAPLIDRYQLTYRDSPCMVGNVLNHPILTGPVVTTSEVWIFAPELGWARTYSRLYALGRPLGADEPEN